MLSFVVLDSRKLQDTTCLLLRSIIYRRRIAGRIQTISTGPK